MQSQIRIDIARLLNQQHNKSIEEHTHTFNATFVAATVALLSVFDTLVLPSLSPAASPLPLPSVAVRLRFRCSDSPSGFSVPRRRVRDSGVSMTDAPSMLAGSKV